MKYMQVFKLIFFLSVFKIDSCKVNLNSNVYNGYKIVNNYMCMIIVNSRMGREP